MSKDPIITTLYSKDSKGKVRQWRIYSEGDSYYQSSGTIDGKQTEFVGVKCKAKNLGKANQTTAEQQAISEAQNKVTGKLKEGYYYTQKEAENSLIFEKMLAHPLEKYAKKVTFPYWMSNKLDGVASNPIGNKMISRNGRPFFVCAHIEKTLEKFYSKNPNIIFCGELYSHSYKDKFDALISIIRQQKPSKEDIKLAEDKLQYHIYDFYDKDRPNLTTRERMFALEDIFKMFFKNSKILIHEKSKLIENQEQADEFHMNAIQNGYEGSMIRLDDSLYEPGKRSSGLLKRKDFYTEEFKIIDILEGNGAWQGKAKKVLVDVNGVESECGIRGSFEFCEDLLKNKNKYLNAQSTVRHFGKTKDGLLRMGVVIAIRNYE